MRRWGRFAIAAVFFLFASALAVDAQQQAGEKDPNVPSAPQPTGSATHVHRKEPTAITKPVSLSKPLEHRFWDRENIWLFAGVGAGRALDYASTLNLRHRGIDEAFLSNSIVG